MLDDDEGRRRGNSKVWIWQEEQNHLVWRCNENLGNGIWMADADFVVRYADKVAFKGKNQSRVSIHLGFHV